MTRPRHGLSLEEALRRWSDPEAWAEIEALVERTSPGRRLDPEIRATAVFKRVLGEFRRKLCDGELVASATHERPDPTNPRFVVDPDVMRASIIRLDLNQIVGPGVRLCNPEIFTPDAIPLNVREIPAWLLEVAGGNGAQPPARLASMSAAEPGRRQPERGLTIEEALQRWSDPSDWAAMNALSEAARPVSNSAGQPPTPSVVRHQEYCRRRKPLEDELLRKLRGGELIASATHERPSPTDPRFVVSPETFDRVGFEWDWPDVMTGIGISIHNVEIFSPDEVPLNVDPEHLPAWLRRATSGREQPMQAAPPQADIFWHDSGYRHVRLRGREYSLTQTQAEIVEVLHAAYLSGDPWRHVEQLRHAVKFESPKLAQIFRRLRDWQELILSDRRGRYKLNLPD
jgi:hypothetical protein